MVERFKHFEVPQGGIVQREVIVPLVEGDSRQTGGISAQMLRHVMQKCPCGTDCCGSVLQPEPVQRGNLEVFPHSKHRCLSAKDPIIVRAEHRSERSASHRIWVTAWFNGGRWPDDFAGRPLGAPILQQLFQ